MSSYPPSLNSRASQSSGQIDLLRALNEGPPESVADTATLSSFQGSERPLLNNNHSRLSVQRQSLASTSEGSPAMNFDTPTGSPTSDRSNNSNNRPPPLVIDSLSSKYSDAEVSPRTVPSSSNLAARKASLETNDPVSRWTDWSIKYRKNSADASATGGLSPNQKRKGSGAGLATTSPTSPVSRFNTSPMLPRSTIIMNPFGPFRRKLAMSRGDKQKIESQFVVELLSALDDYIQAFGAEHLALSPASPAIPMSNQFDPYPLASSYNSQTHASLGQLRIPREQLKHITDEMDTLVDEIIEQLPEFQTALHQGAYGPFSLSRKELALSGSAERFGAYEPSHPQELLMGQHWAQRLRRDLSLSSDSESAAASSPASNFSNSPAMSFGFNSPKTGLNEFSAAEMQRGDSQRSVELLEQGRERWQSYVAKTQP